MAAMLRLGQIGASVGMYGLSQAAQLCQIKQNEKHCEETIEWAKRNYRLDSQSVLLDALDHSKEEIRAQYETHAARIDTLLLALALIWPYALNTIQFSDPFIPRTYEECPDCLESRYGWLTRFWVAFLGLTLLLPFWGMLMLIRCKLKLDGWLEGALEGLIFRRQKIMRVFKQLFDSGTFEGPFAADDMGLRELIEQEDPRHVVSNLVDEVLRKLDDLNAIWTSECAGLINWAMLLLCLSAWSALLLTGVSMFLYLHNTGGVHTACAPYLFFLLAVACVVPIVYLVRKDYISPARGVAKEINAEIHPREHRNISCNITRSPSLLGTRRAKPPRLGWSFSNVVRKLQCCRRRDPSGNTVGSSRCRSPLLLEARNAD